MNKELKEEAEKALLCLYIGAPSRVADDVNKKVKEYINKMASQIDLIKEECLKPTCISYDYDPTPTSEERLKNILRIINS